MSIPLDRLYHYIDDVVQSIAKNNVLIYRFYPHGSKKLSDLRKITEPDTLNWVDQMKLRSLICHDQEPLDFHLYNQTELWNEFSRIKTQNQLLTPEHVPGLQDLITEMHLRVKLWLPFNCYDKVLLCHSEKNSRNLKLYEDHGFIGVYWWSHAVIARDWFRYAEHDLKLIPNFETINKDFLVYNRAWSGTREYRLLFAELVANNNLVNACNMKFSPLDNGTHYSAHNFNNKNLSIQRTDLENIYPVNTFNPCASADYDSEDYASSGIEVVLETLFDDQRNHLTEKSLRPIACGRPFMLVSTPGSLKYLQSYGFETFDGLINEDYDQIINPVQRLNAVVKEMQRIKNLNHADKNALWKELYNISKRNQERFFSSEWQNTIISEFVDNLNLGLAELEKHVTGKYWYKLRKLGESNPEFVRISESDTPTRTLKQRDEIVAWLEQRNQ